MADIINLNKKRKAQARTKDEAQAAQNRLKHGRTKQEKQAQKRQADKLELRVASHQRETPED